jgi:hypothetical protein
LCEMYIQDSSNFQTWEISWWNLCKCKNQLEMREKEKEREGEGRRRGRGRERGEGEREKRRGREGRSTLRTQSLIFWFHLQPFFKCLKNTCILITLDNGSSCIKRG